MEFKIIDKMISKKFIINDFGEFSFYEVIELLDDLKGISWAGSRINIQDLNLKKWLLSLDIITDSNGRSVYTSNEQKIEELRQKLYKQNTESY